MSQQCCRCASLHARCCSLRAVMAAAHACRVTPRQCSCLSEHHSHRALSHQHACLSRAGARLSSQAASLRVEARAAAAGCVIFLWGDCLVGALPLSSGDTKEIFSPVASAQCEGSRRWLPDQATWSRRRARRGAATRCAWVATRSTSWTRCRWTPTPWSTCWPSTRRWDGRALSRAPPRA